MHFSRPLRTARRLLILAALSAALAGCANSPHLRDFQQASAPYAVQMELEQVPFFPQRDYQCGPAALATLLAAKGIDVQPDELVPQVYIAGRRGSLQLELKATARRYGLLPYEHSGAFAGLLAQLKAGQPALVLQNLAFEWAPVWHYAVVVGYHPDQQQLVLRSGRERRKTLSLKEFERTWRYSDYWFLTVHSPGEIPVGAEALAYLRAAAGLEASGQLEAAAGAYGAATNRWPTESLAWMGLGNTRYRQEAYGPAERAFREAITLAPDQPAAWHNLAWALIRQERYEEAQSAAQEAVSLAAADSAGYRGALNHLENLRRRQSGS